MHYSILIDKYSLTPFSYLENIIHAFIDICLLFFIPLYLIGKKTYLFFIPYTIITILVIVNVSYSRFFYTYMPPILYGEFNNLDGLSANVFATIRFSDITILITTLASILSYKQFHRAYSEIRRKTSDEILRNPYDNNWIIQTDTYTVQKNDNEYNFYSRDKENIDSAITVNNLTNIVSFDEVTFIYGIKNKGIYAYNAQKMQLSELATGNDEFNITKYENNKLYYDNKEIDVN